MSKEGMWIIPADAAESEILQRVAFSLGWKWEQGYWADGDRAFVHGEDDDHLFFYFNKTIENYEEEDWKADNDNDDLNFDDFSDLLSFLKEPLSPIKIDDNVVVFDDDSETIQVGCTKVPYDIVRKIYGRLPKEEG